MLIPHQHSEMPYIAAFPNSLMRRNKYKSTYKRSHYWFMLVFQKQIQYTEPFHTLLLLAFQPFKLLYKKNQEVMPFSGLKSTYDYSFDFSLKLVACNSGKNSSSFEGHGIILLNSNPLRCI